MVTRLQINNFKSVKSLDQPLARVTVIIGANGVGKSNIIESILWASAAANVKLDHEFLASRGVRLPSDPRMLRSAFARQQQSEVSTIRLFSGLENSEVPPFEVSIRAERQGDYVRWEDVGKKPLGTVAEVLAYFRQLQVDENTEITRELIDPLYKKALTPFGIQDFLAFSPDADSIRNLLDDGQVQPLGIGGQGLFRLLRDMAKHSPQELVRIEAELKAFEWFASMKIVDQDSYNPAKLLLRDKYLLKSLQFIDQRVVNEGLLYVLLYVVLLISQKTPKFFAIENIESGLNPALCRQLMKRIVDLSRQDDKQVILTTHSPSVLDGMDLHADDQILYVASRDEVGATILTKIEPPKQVGERPPVRLSEAFLRGYLGGLPRGLA